MHEYWVFTYPEFLLLSGYFREELQQRIRGKDLPQEGPVGSCSVTGSGLKSFSKRVSRAQFGMRKRNSVTSRRQLQADMVDRPEV